MNSWNCVYDSGVFALVLGQQQHIKYARYQQDHHIEWLSQNENLHDISNVLHVTDFSPLFAISFVIHGSLSLRVCVCVCWLTHVNSLRISSTFAITKFVCATVYTWCWNSSWVSKLSAHTHTNGSSTVANSSSINTNSNWIFFERVAHTSSRDIFHVAN